MGNYSLGWWALNADNTYKNINGNPVLQIGRILSQQEKTTIDKSINDISQFVTFHLYYIIEKENMDELLTLIHKINNKSKRLETSYFSNDYHMLRLLCSVVSEFVLYINHIEYTLKGKSKENFKKISSRYYDEFFEYRFLYKLRNFITHCSLPEITVTSNINSKNRRIYLDTTYLLTYDSWSTVKDDLEIRKEGIDMLDLFNNAKIMFENFHKEVVKINESKYATSMFILGSYVKISNSKMILPVLVNPYTEEEIKLGKLGWSNSFNIFSRANQNMLDLNIEEFIQ